MIFHITYGLFVILNFFITSEMFEFYIFNFFVIFIFLHFNKI